MNVRMNGSTVFLDRKQSLELVDAAGAVACVKAGMLWITMENDSRDIMLEPGQCWTIDRNGLTLVQAEKPSTLRLTDSVEKESSWKDRVSRAWDAVLVASFDPAKRGPVPYY